MCVLEGVGADGKRGRDGGYEGRTERRDEMKSSAGSARKGGGTRNYSTQHYKNLHCVSALSQNCLNTSCIKADFFIVYIIFKTEV